MSLAVVVEGVETRDQLRFLRELDCTVIQGYYLSRASPTTDPKGRPRGKNMSQHQRMADLRAVMHDAGIDLVALAPGAHMHWLLGFSPHADERPCLLLVGHDEAVVLMPAFECRRRTRSDVTAVS